jgi:hypothetical protein
MFDPSEAYASFSTSEMDRSMANNVLTIVVIAGIIPLTIMIRFFGQRDDDQNEHQHTVAASMVVLSLPVET